MKTYRSSDHLTGGKIKEIGGFLTKDGIVTCVVSFEDGSSVQEDYLVVGNSRARPGMYWVKYADGQGFAVEAAQFEQQYEEVA